MAIGFYLWRGFIHPVHDLYWHGFRLIIHGLAVVAVNFLANKIEIDYAVVKMNIAYLCEVLHA
jgi:hypothetical protein